MKKSAVPVIVGAVWIFLGFMSVFIYGFIAAFASEYSYLTTFCKTNLNPFTSLGNQSVNLFMTPFLILLHILLGPIMLLILFSNIIINFVLLPGNAPKIDVCSLMSAKPQKKQKQ